MRLREFIVQNRLDCEKLKKEIEEENKIQAALAAKRSKQKLAKN